MVIYGYLGLILIENYSLLYKFTIDLFILLLKLLLYYNCIYIILLIVVKEAYIYILSVSIHYIYYRYISRAKWEKVSTSIYLLAGPLGGGQRDRDRDREGDRSGIEVGVVEVGLEGEVRV